MRLPHAFRGLFKREDDAALVLGPPAAADTAPGASAPARQRPVRSDKARLRQFQHRLRTAARTSQPSEPLVAGRLQIIALSRVKARLGGDWQRLATKVHRLTRQILERRLADQDVYVQVGDRYMILFASLSTVEATFKAQAIAREITVFLIGELPEVDEAPVRLTVHEVDPGELKGGPSLESLVARMDQVAAREAAARADGGPRPLEMADRGPVQFDYLPIWSRRGKAVVGYVCSCRPGTGDAGQDLYELDCLALRTVLASLPEMERQGHAALVVAPIHWDTLVQLQRRQSYLDLCRQVPGQLNRRLGFAVLNVAAGAWRDLIRDRLVPLRSFARFFIVCVPPEPTQIRDLADRGVDALAFEAAPPGGFQDPQHERISGSACDASRHRLATCALGVEDRGTVLALLAAGSIFSAAPRSRPRSLRRVLPTGSI